MRSERVHVFDLPPAVFVTFKVDQEDFIDLELFVLLLVFRDFWYSIVVCLWNLYNLFLLTLFFFISVNII